MELEQPSNAEPQPPSLPSPSDAIPARSIPTRVLRAQPSEQTLRETAWVLFVAALPFLFVGGLILAVLVGLWFERSSSGVSSGINYAVRLLRGAGVMGGLIAGYGIVCLMRALRMRRQAERIAQGQSGDPE